MSDRPVIIALTVLSVLTGCTGGEDKGVETTAVPRPVAYPRLDLPSHDSTAIVEGLPVEVRVNKAASACLKHSSDGRSRALTVDYPSSVGTSVYYTFIPVSKDNLSKILEARRERIALNLNGAPAMTTHAFSDSIEAVIVTALTGSQTPVQLLAEVNDSWVVSATAFVHNSSSARNYDSIRPLYDFLSREMEKTLGDLTVIKSRR